MVEAFSRRWRLQSSICSTRCWLRSGRSPEVAVHRRAGATRRIRGEARREAAAMAVLDTGWSPLSWRGDGSALQTLAETRQAAERVSRTQPVSALHPRAACTVARSGASATRAGRAVVSHPSRRSTASRSLIRCVILRRPVPDKVEIRIVWVSGAFSELSVCPSMRSTSDLEGYDHLVERMAVERRRL